MGIDVEPTEAAWELLEDTVGVFDREVERMLKLGMIVAAVDTVLGVVAGLYRVRGSEDGDFLLSWAPDFPLEHAALGGGPACEGRYRVSGGADRRSGTGLGGLADEP